VIKELCTPNDSVKYRNELDELKQYLKQILWTR
jgi:hypothetical protein